MSTGYCCLGDSYAESAVMNKTRVVNVFVIIWRHSYGLSYAALLIVHLIFFRCPRNKKHRCELRRKRTHLTIGTCIQFTFVVLPTTLQNGQSRLPSKFHSVLRYLQSKVRRKKGLGSYMYLFTPKFGKLILKRRRSVDDIKSKNIS